MAAPVFSKVMQGALRLLQIPPDRCVKACLPAVPSVPLLPDDGTRTAQLGVGPQT